MKAESFEFKMKIENIILALEDARARGIDKVTVILNSDPMHFCQVEIKEVSVSNITGYTLYIDGYNKGFVGWKNRFK